MITVAALAPHPPLLLRELTGALDPVPELRAACRAVAHDLVADADEVVVVGGDEITREWDVSAGSPLGRFRGPGPGRETLPLSLGVGARLLEEAGWAGPVTAHAVAWDADRETLERLAERLAGRAGRTAVLVLGDGSARRSATGPGALDERAFDFDDVVAKALADGEAAALVDLDHTLAAELLVLGRAAFGFLGVLAERQPARPDAALTYRADPFGVDYLVARWRF